MHFVDPLKPRSLTLLGARLGLGLRSFERLDLGAQRGEFITLFGHD
jgi:hypothetical protein